MSEDRWKDERGPTLDECGDEMNEDTLFRDLQDAHRIIDALVAALEQSKFALETLNIRNGQCGPIIAMADAALAMARKGG